MSNFLNLVLLMFLIDAGVSSCLTAKEELCQHIYNSCPSLQHHLNAPKPFLPDDSRTFIETVAYPLVLVDVDDYNQRLSMTAGFEVYWMLENSSAWYSNSLSEVAKQLSSCKFPLGHSWRPRVLLLNNIAKDDPLSQ